jgi:large subunit ribosomal protein L25
MSTATLTATRRDTAGKGTSRAMRREGQTPAVIYGHSRETESLAIPTRELERLLSRISTGSTVVELNMDGRRIRTLIRDVQHHPTRKEVLHVDFVELVAGEKVITKVPLRFVGTPEGVRVDSGVLEEKLHEISVEVDPSNLPESITVDVSQLAVAKSLHVSDLELPEGVTVLEDPGNVVASVLPPRVSEAAGEAAEPAEDEPELIRKPKEEE